MWTSAAFALIAQPKISKMDSEGSESVTDGSGCSAAACPMTEERTIVEGYDFPTASFISGDEFIFLLWRTWSQFKDCVLYDRRWLDGHY